MDDKGDSKIGRALPSIPLFSSFFFFVIAKRQQRHANRIIITISFAQHLSKQLLSLGTSKTDEVFRQLAAVERVLQVQVIARRLLDGLTRESSRVIRKRKSSSNGRSTVHDRCGSGSIDSCVRGWASFADRDSRCRARSRGDGG